MAQVPHLVPSVAKGDKVNANMREGLKGGHTALTEDMRGFGSQH